MLRIAIPGREDLAIKNVVFDFNGTLAKDGVMAPSLAALVAEVKSTLAVYVLTADTYRSVENQCSNLGIRVHVLDREHGGAAKRRFVQELGAESTVCVGNGVNDAGMFEACALAIVVMGEEGCSTKSLASADIAVRSGEDALGLLLNPKRITATLRE